MATTNIKEVEKEQGGQLEPDMSRDPRKCFIPLALSMLLSAGTWSALYSVQYLNKNNMR